MTTLRRLRLVFTAAFALAACRSEGVRAPASSSAAGARFAPVPAAPLVVRSAPFDVEHYALDIDLDPAARTIRATCSVRVWPVRDPLSEIDLDFAGLVVESVHDRDGRALSFEQAGEKLAIHLAEPCPVRDFAEVSIRYGGHPRKGLWFTRERDGKPTQVFTHGECRDAHWWFPCFDEPADRATSEIRVTMPASWHAIACGERVERTESIGPGAAGGRATERWRMTFPHPAYLESLVAGDLVVEEDAWTGVPLELVAAPDLEPYLKPTLSDTAAILGFFSEITGTRYPYAKYAQCCVDGFPFGGMENVSATTLVDTALLDERGLLDSPGAPLVAHEAAHQWFGDLLTCKDWTQAWLNEGFATYMEALWTERSRGADALRLEMRDMQDASIARDSGPNRRPIVYGVCHDPIELFLSGHVYQGAAVRLHLLRSVIGDEAFFAGLKRYVGENRGRAVTTDDVRIAMESAAKRDLRGFFDQWFLKPGSPELDAAWDWNESAQRVTLTLEQVQASGGGTPEVFRVPIEIEIRAAGRSRIERIELDQRRQTFELAATERPAWVRVDPHGWVPKRLDETKSEREWLAIAEICEDPCGRRDAVRVLARRAHASQVEDERDRIARFLADRLERDPRAEVRAAIAEGCAVAGRKPKSESEVDRFPLAVVRRALVLRAVNDDDVRVRAAALRALASIGPDPELEAIARHVRALPPSWNVLAAACALFASSDRESPARAFDDLAADLDPPSPHGVRKAHVLAEIAKLKDDRVLSLCARIAGDAREPDSVRIVAVKALAERGRGDALVRRELLGLLDTDRWRLRREVIPALGALHDPEARARLERRWVETPFDMEKRAIEAALAANASDA